MDTWNKKKGTWKTARMGLANFLSLSVLSEITKHSNELKDQKTCFSLLLAYFACLNEVQTYPYP